MSAGRPSAQWKDPKEEPLSEGELDDFRSLPPPSLEPVHRQHVTPARVQKEPTNSVLLRPAREVIEKTPLPPNREPREGKEKRRNSHSHHRRSSAHKSSEQGGKVEKERGMVDKEKKTEKDLDLPLAHLNLDDSGKNKDKKSTKPSKNRMAGGRDVERRHRSRNGPHADSSKSSADLLPAAYQHGLKPGRIVTTPIHDPWTLCFPLPFTADYESIIGHFEILKASVTVIRRPVVGRPGVVVLKWSEDYVAKIVHDHGAVQFENRTRTIKPKYPGLITLTVDKDDVDLNKLEQEIETNFGIVAQLTITDSRTGTVRFVDTKDAGGALLAGFHKGEHFLPGVTIAFQGMFVRGEDIEEWEVETDNGWPDHRVNMQQARATLLNYKERNKPWTDISMKRLLRKEMDDEHKVSLVGGPLVFGLSIDSVRDYFTRNFRAVKFVDSIDEREPHSENHEPANILIVVKYKYAADLLSVKEHNIDGFKFYVGLPGSIEITTFPMDARVRRIVGQQLAHQFGSTVGFRCVQEEDQLGFARYRITFMHRKVAIRAHEYLSTCEGQSFIGFMPADILVNVKNLETWKTEVKEIKK